MSCDCDELHQRFSEFLCEVTGSILSYTNYPVSTMVQYTEAYYRRILEDEIREELNGGV